MNRYLTAAIPYVNSVPHLGYALEAIQTDTVARFWRQQGDTVYWQFGTDDNSLKNVRAAKDAGEDVAQYVARHSQAFRELTEKLGLANDGFIRTRDDKHIRGAQKLWSMMKAEDIYTKPYVGLYCVGCEAFYTPEEAPNGVCATHQKPLEKVEEENYFFRLSAYQQTLETLISNDTLRIRPESRKNEMLGFIRQGLEDFSISRSVARAENWGVPVPNDPSQVMYVWVDALANYITGIDFADDGELYEKFWAQCPWRVHVVGKDILRFHAIYWAAFLLSAGVPLPTEIFSHGFITVNGGQKMSKSLGNVISPADVLEKYGIDATRFLLLRDLPCGEDGDISWERFEILYRELANGLGNLVGRVAAMANKYAPEGLDVAAFDARAVDITCKQAMERFDFRVYSETVWTIVRAANEKVDKEAPFKVYKTDPVAAVQTLAELAGMIRWIGAALTPIMPTIGAEITRRYSAATPLVGEPLFPRKDETA